MDKNRLTSIIKSATKVNLDFSATLLNLSKDYLRAMNEAVVKDSSASTQDDSVTKPESSRRTPLIVSGRKGEVANASIAVNNTSGISGTVTFQIVGEFSKARVETDPATLSLNVDESTIVRVLAHIDTSLEVNKDYAGVVMIPELGLKLTDFVVRRLPDLHDKKHQNKATTHK